MKIVVDIKDDDYYDIIGDALIGEFTMMEVINAVKNGTPLPKGYGRKFEEIVVEYPPAELCTYPEYRGKLYFSIKYEENGEHIIGFGTYNPEVLSRYLREYFIVSMIIEANAEPERKKEKEMEELKKYSESDIKSAIQTILLKKGEDLVGLTQMYDIEEGECVGYHKALMGLLDVLHIEYAENEFKPLI